MIRHVLVNKGIGICFRHFRFVTERDFPNVEIKRVRLLIVKPVGFVRAHSLFIPFAGKHALTADGLKPFSYTANAGKQVNKPEGIVRVMRRRFRQHFSQKRFFC